MNAYLWGHLWRAFIVVRTGTLAGLLVAALAYPIVALAGIGTKSAVDSIGSIEALRLAKPAEASRVYAADSTTLLTQFYEEYRIPAPITEIAVTMQQAIVAVEDARFYEHHGVDARGVIRAYVANREAGGVSQGASTLTMQYVRNVLRDEAKTPEEVHNATERTASRKWREIQLAIELEQRLSKAEILERYLNVAYFGHHAYGIRAAAEIYFSKLPRDLTVAEAATLAGLVQAPSEYDPANDRAAGLQRRNYVIDRMLALHYVTPEQADAATSERLALRLTEPPNGCVSVTYNDWGYFCDLFLNWWTAQPAFGASPQERLQRLLRGGYTVVTSIDPRIQEAARQHVLDKEPATSQYAHGLVMIEPGTGRIPAMTVNRIYSLDQSGNGVNSDPGRRATVRGTYPNTVNPLLGGGDLPGYQAGSTFKMFVMLAALEQGLPLSTAIASPRTYSSSYVSSPGEPATCGGHWCPSNASASMTGRQTIWSGFSKSVNTFFVQLEQRVGAQNAVRMAERLGLTWRTAVDQTQASPERANSWGAFTLGVADTTPLEMANAYATVAADGMYCEPLPVRSIVDADGRPATLTGPDGTPVEVAAPRCRQAVSAEVARGAADAARCVTGYGAAAGSCGGWSTAPEVYGIVKRPVAGKTGTTDSNRAAWFVGFTPTLAAAGFIADPDNPLHSVGDGNAGKPIRAVAETLRDALAGTPVADFTRPPPQIVSGTTRG